MKKYINKLFGKKSSEESIKTVKSFRIPKSKKFKKFATRRKKRKWDEEVFFYKSDLGYSYNALWSHISLPLGIQIYPGIWATLQSWEQTLIYAVYQEVYYWGMNALWCAIFLFDSQKWFIILYDEETEDFGVRSYSQDIKKKAKDIAWNDNSVPHPTIKKYQDFFDSMSDEQLQDEAFLEQKFEVLTKEVEEIEKLNPLPPKSKYDLTLEKLLQEDIQQKAPWVKKEFKKLEKYVYEMYVINK